MAKNTEILHKLGLNVNDTKLYLELLESGRISITELSRNSDVPRSTAYESIERLQGKGLVSQVIVGNRKELVAEDPSKIKTVLYNNKLKKEAELAELNRVEAEIPEFLEFAKKLTLSSLGELNVQVKFYEGERGFRQVSKRSLNSAQTEILFISNMDEWKQIFTDEFAYKDYVPARLEKGLYARTLAMRSDLATGIRSEDQKYKREMRFLPDNFKFKPTIIITKTEVSIMTSSKPYSAILIEGEIIAKLFTDIFNELWENTPTRYVD